MNEHDQFAIGIFHNKYSWAMFLKTLEKVCYQFLFLAGCTLEAKDTAKRVDKWGGYGLGILVCYKCFGSEKLIQSIDSKMKKIEVSFLNMINCVLSNFFHPCPL